MLKTWEGSPGSLGAGSGRSDSEGIILLRGLALLREDPTGLNLLPTGLNLLPTGLNLLPTSSDVIIQLQLHTLLITDGGLESSWTTIKDVAIKFAKFQANQRRIIFDADFYPFVVKAFVVNAYPVKGDTYEEMGEYRTKEHAKLGDYAVIVDLEKNMIKQVLPEEKPWRPLEPGEEW